jgi:poly(3-hydroxybutyrate) depolymerase
VRAGEPLLIVAPMSGHYATLLRGTVRAMLPKHDVFITDWRDAKLVPVSEGSFDLDDYIDISLNFPEIHEATGKRPHMLAVCQPSVPAYAATAVHECRQASGTAEDADHDGRAGRHAKAPTAVNTLATNGRTHGSSAMSSPPCR